jgi:hypothetical protein
VLEISSLAGERSMSNGTNRFFGGSPLGVIVRLILLSVVVGVLLAALGVDPWNIWRSMEALARRIASMGFEAVEWIWRYFLLGAIIVVPIWILVRLLRVRRGRP